MAFRRSITRRSAGRDLADAFCVLAHTLDRNGGQVSLRQVGYRATSLTIEWRLQQASIACGPGGGEADPPPTRGASPNVIACASAFRAGVVQRSPTGSSEHLARSKRGPCGRRALPRGQPARALAQLQELLRSRARKFVSFGSRPRGMSQNQSGSRRPGFPAAKHTSRRS